MTQRPCKQKMPRLTFFRYFQFIPNDFVGVTWRRVGISVHRKRCFCEKKKEVEFLSSYSLKCICKSPQRYYDWNCLYHTLFCCECKNEFQQLLDEDTVRSDEEEEEEEGQI
jgi:hypothetical protein